MVLASRLWMGLLFLVLVLALAACTPSEDGEGDGPGGKVDDPDAVIATLDASPQQVVTGRSSRLIWSSERATSCEGSGFDTGGATSGQVDVEVIATTEFILTCRSDDGRDEDDSVTVQALMLTASVSFAPDSILAGQSTTIEWSSGYADACEGVDFATGGLPSGSTTVTPAASRSYEVECTAAGTGAVATASADVTVLSILAELEVFATSIVEGESVLLKWKGIRATQCTGTGFDTGGKTSGGVVVRPTLTTTYELECTAGGGALPAQDSAVLVVEPPPPPKALDIAVLDEDDASFYFGDRGQLLVNAPEDIDLGRIAAIADDLDSFLLAFPQGRDDAVYVFVEYDEGTRDWVHDFRGFDPEVGITGTPEDADPSQFGALFDGTSARIYMRSKTSDELLHVFVFDPDDTVTFVYGLDGAPTVAISGAPADADFSRWAVLHDGERYRLYVGREGDDGEIYPFAIDPASGAFEYGFDSDTDVIELVDVPETSNIDNFAVLHDGEAQQLIFTTRTLRKP